LKKNKSLSSNFGKTTSNRNCGNCNYFNLEYCTLYDILVEQDDMCAMYMPVFKYENKAIPKKYAHIDFKPPQSVINVAKRALNKIDLAGDGLEQQTKIWARKVANGETITPEKAKQGYRWFARNKRFKNSKKDSPAWISWLFWFGSPGQSWFNKLWQQMEVADKKGG